MHTIHVPSCVWCCAWVDYVSSWTASDTELDCVSVKVDTQKLQSKDCATVLPFACIQLPGSVGPVDLYLLTLQRAFDVMSSESKTWCQS